MLRGGQTQVTATRALACRIYPASQNLEMGLPDDPDRVADRLVLAARLQNYRKLDPVTYTGCQLSNAFDLQ